MRAVGWALLALGTAAVIVAASVGLVTREWVVWAITATFVVQSVSTFMYGLLAPWWLTRTGRGFFAKSCALTLVLGMYLWSIYMRAPIPYATQFVLWVVLIVAIGWGVLWTMIYKQFIENRPNTMARDKEHQ